MPTGTCLCGAVEVDVRGELPPADACHCTQCRKWSGHVWASCDPARDDVSVTGEVAWYQSSARVRRGFCPACGSSLLWDVAGRDRIAVSMGLFPNPTGGRLAEHIFTAHKGDYYPLDDGVPAHP